MMEHKKLKVKSKVATRRLRVTHRIANDLADRKNLQGEEREKFIQDHMDHHLKY